MSWNYNLRSSTWFTTSTEFSVQYGFHYTYQRPYYKIFHSRGSWLHHTPTARIHANKPCNLQATAAVRTITTSSDITALRMSNRRPVRPSVFSAGVSVESPTVSNYVHEIYTLECN